MPAPQRAPDIFLFRNAWLFFLPSILIGVLIIARTVAVVVFDSQTLISPTAFRIACLTLLPPSVISILVVIRLRIAHQRKLRQHEYRLCLTCHYPLAAEPATGRCPECGSGYTIQDTINTWQGKRT